MPDERLGYRLYELGWKQGVLLPPLPWSVVFEPSDPVIYIARAAASSTPSAVISGATQNFNVASGMLRRGDQLVVASQDCDIVKSPNQEPNIIALRAFTTDNTRLLRAAASNSSRFFLLDRPRNLIVDATIQALVEKPVLLSLSPAIGAPDEDMRRRLARWLARRFNRPAIPDDVVEAVCRPILENLASLQAAGDYRIDVLDRLHHVRFQLPTGAPPFAVRLLFIIEDRDRGDASQVRLALADLIALVRKWFNTSQATLEGWDAYCLDEISAADLLGTVELFLDQYTYFGDTLHGLEPHQFMP